MTPDNFKPWGTLTLAESIPQRQAYDKAKKEAYSALCRRQAEAEAIYDASEQTPNDWEAFGARLQANRRQYARDLDQLRLDWQMR